MSLTDSTVHSVSRELSFNIIIYQTCLGDVIKKSTGVLYNVPEQVQFNSKTLFKGGDPVSLQLIFPGAIQTCEQYNNFSYIYTKQHRFIGQSQANTTYTFIQNTYT